MLLALWNLDQAIKHGTCNRLRMLKVESIFSMKLNIYWTLSLLKQYQTSSIKKKMKLFMDKHMLLLQKGLIDPNIWLFQNIINNRKSSENSKLNRMRMSGEKFTRIGDFNSWWKKRSTQLFLPYSSSCAWYLS